MKTIFTVLLLSAMSFACGTERWAVKIMPPYGDPEKQDVEQLTKLLAPMREMIYHAQTTRLPQEGLPVTVEAYLIGYKLEDDGDFHLVLKGVTSQTMIAEIPAPACVKDKELKSRVTALREWVSGRWGKPGTKYKTLALPAHVEVTGALFFDYIHGQTGVAKNGVELHPVTKIEIVGVVSEVAK